MGRVRLDDIRRRELIDAAIRAVAAHGLEKATVSVIAGHADSSPGIVHHYFNDKISLLAAAMRAIRAPLAKLFVDCLAAQPVESPNRLQAVIDACFDSAVFSPVTVSAWVSFSSAAPHVRAFGRIRLAQRQRLVSTLSDALKGRVDEGYRRWYADGIASAIDGAWFNAATIEGAANADRARAAIETQLAGFVLEERFDHA